MKWRSFALDSLFSCIALLSLSNQSHQIGHMVLLRISLFERFSLCEIYGHLIVCKPASEITVSKSFELLGNWDLSSLSCRPILCSAIFIGITETLPQDGISEICNVCRSFAQTNNSECQGLARSNLSGLSYSSLHFPFIFPSENFPLLVSKSLHSFLKHAHTTWKEEIFCQGHYIM